MRALFIGKGTTAVCWYRCALPAIFSGNDWIGVAGEPPELRFQTGMVRDEHGVAQTKLPNYLDYDVIVVQLAASPGWRKLIGGLRERGVRVLYEVDDYLHSIPRLKDHDFRHHFTREHLKGIELTIAACDGVIASTDYIARRYAAFASGPVWVCENGIDIFRYKLTRPPRDTVNVGWAGATGHELTLIPWLRELGALMAVRDDVCFVSIGQGFALEFDKRWPGRGIAVPFTALETYPAAMTLFDIAIAPAATSGRSRAFYRGKSDLRWLEASALGIPTIAEPTVYRHIEHGVTGFHASTPQEARGWLEALIDDESLRRQVGDNARRYVEEKRDMPVAANQWRRVFAEAGERAAA